MALAAVNKPNFFILGAAKSGTTSLYFYLKQHPEIFMTAVKEPSFFCNGFQVIKNPIHYFRLFEPVTTEKAIGEASHVYMSNPPTARVLKGLFPDAKFIVILRNPAERAYSLYHHMRREGLEHSKTFEEALDLEEKRLNSESFRNHCPQYLYNYMYFRSGLYGSQLQRYFSLFGQKAFHVLTLDMLETDPICEVQKIYQFLGVSPDFSPSLALHNEGTMTARIPSLQYLARKINKPRMLRDASLRLMNAINMSPTEAMNPETRENLLQRYSNDLKVLHKLTGIRF